MPNEPTDLDILNAARNVVVYSKGEKSNSLVEWTLSSSWASAYRYTDAVHRGSAWIGHKYVEFKSGIVISGEALDTSDEIA